MRGTIDSTRACADSKVPGRQGLLLDALEQAGRTIELAEALQRETEIALQLEPLGVAVVEERGRPLGGSPRLHGRMPEARAGRRHRAGLPRRVPVRCSVPARLSSRALQVGADQLIAFAARVEPSGEALVHPGRPTRSIAPYAARWMSG